MTRRHIILVILAAALLRCTAVDSAPRFVYLTWQGDTSTTVTVYYHTDAAADDSTVRYDEQPRGGRIDDYALTAHGRRHQIEGLADGRTIHVVELSGLKPATTYYFVAGDLENGFSSEHSFRTIPNDGQPIRFVVGGDMGVLPDVGELMARAGATDPMFAIVGGDITYANGNIGNVGKWDQWLEFWQRHMRTPDGHDIPIVAAIGNHEVNGGFGQPLEQAPFYTGYLAKNRDRTYFTMQFGPNLTLFVLDSGHVARHDGAQAEWLETELQRCRQVPNRVAAYHVPLYPTARPFHYEFSVRGRTHWAPLFDRYGLTAAFEHHDHAFKRTWPIRNGQRDPSGTVYLGDGCFGMPHRPLTEGSQWYQAKAAPLQHFWSVEVAGDQIHCRAISKTGDVFDVYPPDAPGAAEAEQMWAVLAWPESINEAIPEQVANRRLDSTITWTLLNPLATDLEVAFEMLPTTGVRFEPDRQELTLAPGTEVVVNVAVTSDEARNRLNVQTRWRVDAGRGAYETVHTSVMFFRREAVVYFIRGGAAPPMDGSVPALAATPPNLTGFVQRADGQPAAQGTDVWVTAIPAGLHVYAICHDADMANRVSPTTPENSFTFHTPELEAGNPFWNDDNIELFLIPQTEPVGAMQYAVTLGSATYVDRKSAAGEHLRGSGMRANTFRFEDRWTAEFLIPWSDLEQQGQPPPGTVWRLDIARTHTLNQSDISRWANPTASNHAAEHFGYIKFE